MSRVFEALARAGEEKYGKVQRPTEKIENTPLIAPPEERRNPNPEQQFGSDGLSSQLNAGLHKVRQLYPAITNGEKSWRETIEQWVFGWDLKRYSSYPIVALERESLASEQYKMLREQVKRLRAEAGIRSFCISSPVKRDGKTTVAVNLAVALSLDFEEKVLLIDGDLRAPSIHRYFNASETPGLADYLTAEAKMNLKDLVRETFMAGLQILTAGKPSHVAPELLAKERMQQVMEEAKADFPGYHIIIDSPPILSTPDPLVIARQVDGVLLVMRAGKTPRDYLTKALQSLNSNKIMGVVLNGSDLGISSKYYSHYSNNGA